MTETHTQNSLQTTEAPAPPRALSIFAGFDAPTYKALRESIGGDAPEAQFKAHLLVCQRLGLHPVGGHVHLVSRDTWSNGKREIRWTTQIGIDGYRSLAEDTGLYEGPCGLPLFQYDEAGPWTEDVYVERRPYAAKVGVYRQGRREPIWALVVWEHYCPTVYDPATKERRPMAMWAKMPHVMLAKCAEALALRKAFPRQLGGVYTTEEMARHALVSESEVRVSPVDKPEEQRRPRPDAEVFDPRAPRSPKAPEAAPAAAAEVAAREASAATEDVPVAEADADLGHEAPAAPSDAE